MYQIYLFDHDYVFVFNNICYKSVNIYAYSDVFYFIKGMFSENVAYNLKLFNRYQM